MSQQSFAAVSVSLAVVWGVFFYPPPAGPSAPVAATPAIADAQAVARAPALPLPPLPEAGDTAVVDLRGNPDSAPTPLSPAVPAS